MVKRLGLARNPGGSLFEAVQESGWEPVPVFFTHIRPTGATCPLALPRAVILLSPGGAIHGFIPGGVPVLVTGEGTAQSLSNREVFVAPEPSAESLWTLLQSRFPEGGDFLLVRGERSRAFLEEISMDTSWRLHPWITHVERALNPLPKLPLLDGILALSPLQAELLGSPAAELLRFAWGERTARAFTASGFPAHDTCEPRTEALGRMLRAH